MSAEKQTVGIGNTYWILFFVLSLSVGDMTILEDIEAKTDFFVASLIPGTDRRLLFAAGTCTWLLINISRTSVIVH